MWPVWVSFAGSVPCAQHVGSNWKRHLSVREEGRGVAPLGRYGFIEAIDYTKAREDKFISSCSIDNNNE